MTEPAGRIAGTPMAHLHLVALVVRDYDRAIDFFVRVLDFNLVEDVPSTTNDGRPKRWVVVRPKGGDTGILLARADGVHQEDAIGRQFAGRVWGDVSRPGVTILPARACHDRRRRVPGCRVS